ATAVGDDLAVEHHLHPLAARLDLDPVVAGADGLRLLGRERRYFCHGRILSGRGTRALRPAAPGLRGSAIYIGSRGGLETTRCTGTLRLLTAWRRQMFAIFVSENKRPLLYSEAGPGENGP